MIFKIQVIAIILIACCSCIFAQTWSDVDGGMGFNSTNVKALMEYDNELYAGGGFTTAGTVFTTGLASWNGAEWDSVGSNDTAKGVTTFAVHNGVLYFAGLFDPPGSGTGDMFHLGIWDGIRWDKATGGNLGVLTQGIYALASYDGDLYAGGNYTSIGGISATRISRWNGSNWLGLAGGVSGGFIPEVKAMAVYNGELYIGGDFTVAGSTPASYIARWNGSQWDSVAGGVNGIIGSMAVDTANNILYVGGGFTKAGNVDVQYIASWDGSNWSAVGNSIVCCGPMVVYHDELYVGGTSKTGSPTDTVLARWNGINWSPILGPNNTISSLAVFGDKLYVGGYFNSINSMTARYIACYNDYVGTMDLKKKGVRHLGNSKPNPASQAVVIPYFIPHEAEGTLLFYGIKGESVSYYQLDSNMDEIAIPIEQLSPGTYLYSLVIEDQVVDTKKLIIPER